MNAALEAVRVARPACAALLMGKFHALLWPTTVQTANAIYRYCGTSDEYCGNGCQSAFGICGAKSKSTHSHIRRHSHKFRRTSFNL